MSDIWDFAEKITFLKRKTFFVIDGLLKLTEELDQNEENVAGAALITNDLKYEFTILINEMQKSKNCGSNHTI